MEERFGNGNHPQFPDAEVLHAVFAAKLAVMRCRMALAFRAVCRSR